VATASNFWLLRWMDEKSVRSQRDVERIMAQPETLEHLYQYALAAHVEQAQKPSKPNPIVGARGLDLSGELTGADSEDLINESEQLFNQVWHYFDQIVVEGFAPRRYILMYEDEELDLCKNRIIAHSNLLLHLKEIGALDSLVFRQKPNPCVQHGHDVALLDEAGLDRIRQEGSTLIDQLSQGELTDVADHGSHLHYEYFHPLLGQRIGELWNDKYYAVEAGDSDALKRSIAAIEFEYQADFMAADAFEARILSAPLAVATPLHHSILDKTASPSVIDDVAIKLSLPILEGISARDLIQLRREEGAAFERFRIALRTAIKERVDASEAAAPHQVANEIIDDILRPAVWDIGQRLHVARKALARKSAVNVAVSAAAVMIGLRAGIPLLLPAGITAGLGAPTVHYTKHLDTTSEIELSDMYFLWKLQKAPRK